MKYKPFIIICSIIFLSGCEKMKELSGSSIKCNDEIVKQLVVESLSKQISNLSVEKVKALVTDENIVIDMGKLRGVLKQVTFNVDDIRTNNSDPNSNKEYCVANLTVKLPDQVIRDADAARNVYGETNIAQAAVLSNLSLELNQLRTELEYSAQPTDDQKKVYVALENGDALSVFIRDIAVDSLLKNARQNAMELAKQEEFKRVEQEKADAQEYQAVLIAEAQANLDKANENLNLVWNATTKDVRGKLLDEQKLWLKKRDLECKLESSNIEENNEVYRLNCEAKITVQRASELKQKIYYLEENSTSAM